MDKKDFMYQATLRICGNLEIETAMQTLLQYLKNFMPITKMYLQHYDDDFHGMQSIAYADMTEYHKLDLLTPLSKTAGELAKNAPAEPDAFLLEDPQSFPVSREMSQFHGLHLNQGQPEKSSGSNKLGNTTDTLDTVIRQHIRQVLIETKGNISGRMGAAALLGINPSTLRNRMKKLGIDYGKKVQDGYR